VEDKKGNQVIISNSDDPTRRLYRNITEVKQYHRDGQLEDPVPLAERNTDEINSKDTDDQSSDALSDPPEVERRYPERIRKAPDRLNL
jgi:hypothetical protein